MVLLYLLFLINILFLLSTGCIDMGLTVGFVCSFRSDSLAFVFFITLTLISVSVLIWSYYYIDSDREFRRFLTIIIMFLGSMFLLVFSARLLTLFVAWDLLGFISFYLVIFFRTRASFGGGLLTGITNRIGDVFLLFFFGVRGFQPGYTFLLGLALVILVAMTKSAQVPFSSWLTAAMLAPTPVSALVHSSTLVTAGIYLLLRFVPFALGPLLYVGIFTMLMAGWAGIIETDLKKLIALSTLSQLGLIVCCLGLGERSLCFAHLNTHAGFKALIFLCIGTIIHSCYGSQESRSIGGLLLTSPILITVLLAAFGSISGIVFLSGWVTKEAILEGCFRASTGLCTLVLFYLGIGITLAYSVSLLRLLYLSIFNTVALCSSFSCTLVTKVPLLFLLLLSVLQGLVINLRCLFPPSFLYFSDSLVVWAVLGLSLCVLVTLGFAGNGRATTYSNLGALASGLNLAFLPCSSLMYTELSAYHGCGLSQLPAIGAKLSLGTDLLSKSLIFIFFAFFLF